MPFTVCLGMHGRYLANFLLTNNKYAFQNECFPWSIFCEKCKHECVKFILEKSTECSPGLANATPEMEKNAISSKITDICENFYFCLY